jgi:hypothetical protein
LVSDQAEYPLAVSPESATKLDELVQFANTVGLSLNNSTDLVSEASKELAQKEAKRKADEEAETRRKAEEETARRDDYDASVIAFVDNLRDENCADKFSIEPERITFAMDAFTGGREKFQKPNLPKFQDHLNAIKPRIAEKMTLELSNDPVGYFNQLSVALDTLAKFLDDEAFQMATFQKEILEEIIKSIKVDSESLDNLNKKLANLKNIIRNEKLVLDLDSLESEIKAKAERGNHNL